MIRWYIRKRIRKASQRERHMAKREEGECFLEHARKK